MNKYQEALDNIADKLIDCGRTKDLNGETILKEQSELNLLQELVDNPPLKFENLKEGMWIWDDKNKIYNLIYEKRINCAKEKEIEFQWEMPDRECQNFMTDVYEENRFYRREV